MKTIENQTPSQMFKEVLNSFYLDNDQLDFINKEYKRIYEFELNEKCFCLSGNNYSDCCLKNLKDKKSSVLSILRVVKDKSLIKDWKLQTNTRLNEVIEDMKKNQNCFIKGCKNSVFKINLYDENVIAKFIENNNDFYKHHVFSEKYFLKNTSETPYEETTNVNYENYLICENHINDLSEDNDLFELVRILAQNLYEKIVFLKATKKDYLEDFNSYSVSEKMIITLKLRVLSRDVSSLEGEFDLLLKSKNNLLDNYELKVFEFKKSQKLFILKDMLLPPITPITFKAINSYKNFFIELNPMFIIYKDNKCFIYFHKNHKILYTYFAEWNEKLHNQKLIENFISNLIMSNNYHIVFSRKKFDRYLKNNSNLQNLKEIFYQRYQSPATSADEMRLQMYFSNYHYGINILK